MFMPRDRGFCQLFREKSGLGGGFHGFLRDASANMLAACKGAIYVCMSSSELHTLHQAFRDAGGHWSTFLIWAKHHFTLGRSDYQRMYEPILYGWREGADKRRERLLRGREILAELKQEGRLLPSQDWIEWFDRQLAELQPG